MGLKQQLTVLTDTLPALQRLALAYSPAGVREQTLGLFALDARLATVIRSASEPMLAQIRLAWWREMFDRPAADWPEGEPLLALLASWDEERAALVALADGWEAMTGEGGAATAAFSELANARGRSFGALARLVRASEKADVAEVLGREWAVADIAAHLSRDDEREAATALAAQQEWKAQRLSRRLRPLAVLHVLARRSMRRGESLDTLSPGALLPALRAGLLGI